MTTRPKPFSFANSVLRSWWVVLFALFCYVCYEQGIKNRDKDFVKLKQQYQKLHLAKTHAVEQQIHLTGVIQSQSDPAWTELTLMKNLGVVPEGYKKVFFSSEFQVEGQTNNP